MDFKSIFYILLVFLDQHFSLKIDLPIAQNSVQSRLQVSIAKWNSSKTTLTITCSVETKQNGGADKYILYLLCPFVTNSMDRESNFCYMNCNPQCFPNSDMCDQNQFFTSFIQCTPVRHSKYRLDHHFIINSTFIPIGGNWLCQYRGVKSSHLYIKPFVKIYRHVLQLPKKTDKTTTQLITTTSQGHLSNNLSLTNKYHPVQYNIDITTFGQYTFVFGILVAFCISLLVNGVLIYFVCWFRIKSKSNPKQPPPLPPYPHHPSYNTPSPNDATETTSMLTKSSNNHYHATRSVCSQSSSLEQQQQQSGNNTSYFVSESGQYFSIIPISNNFPSRHSSSTNIICQSPVSPPTLPLHANEYVPSQNMIRYSNDPIPAQYCYNNVNTDNSSSIPSRSPNSYTKSKSINNIISIGSNKNFVGIPLTATGSKSGYTNRTNESIDTGSTNVTVIAQHTSQHGVNQPASFNNDSNDESGIGSDSLCLKRTSSFSEDSGKMDLINDCIQQQKQQLQLVLLSNPSIQNSSDA